MDSILGYLYFNAVYYSLNGGSSQSYASSGKPLTTGETVSYFTICYYEAYYEACADSNWESLWK